jgi:hypothetical protein
MASVGSLNRISKEFGDMRRRLGSMSGGGELSSVELKIGGPGSLIS